MDIKGLKRLERSTRGAAESFRGVDAEVHNLLTHAADLIKMAIATAMNLAKREKPTAIPLNTLLYGQQTTSKKDLK